jgi:hypothetical protein
MLAVKAEQYLWLVVIAGAVVVAAMLWLMRTFGRSGGRPSQPSRSTPVGS